MPSGRVRWFDANKGYGFIQTGESTDDVFLPAAALPEGVDLPEPDVPTIATNSPFFTLKSTPSNA